MPKIDKEQIGIAFDMHGCPNRCRHCWLGPGSNRKFSDTDIRWGTAQFRDFISPTRTTIKKLSVATWFREPDYSDNYRHLYELEAELSDGKPCRYELLSVWRLARDKSYADWAKSVGPETCQISFFGTKETNDWFHRRKGAFDDALAATERLLSIGMKPRWQVFLTTKLLPELIGFTELIQSLHLWERVRESGGEFQIYLYPPGPDHEARRIEGYRPTASQVSDLPESILESTRKYLEKDDLWYTEAKLYSEILAENGTNDCKVVEPEELWFLVCSNWDVFANIGTLEKWWCLGNLKRDTVASIFSEFESNRNLGLKTLYQKSPREITVRYGNPMGQKVYSGKEDLLSLYRGVHCESEWKNGDFNRIEQTLSARE